MGPLELDEEERRPGGIHAQTAFPRTIHVVRTQFYVFSLEVSLHVTMWYSQLGIPLELSRV